LFYVDVSNDDYAIVNFIEDGCTAVVPLSRTTLMEDDECFVLWDNRKEYKAYFLLSGAIKMHNIMQG